MRRVDGVGPHVRRFEVVRGCCSCCPGIDIAHGASNISHCTPGIWRWRTCIALMSLFELWPCRQSTRSGPRRWFAECGEEPLRSRRCAPTGFGGVGGDDASGAAGGEDAGSDVGSGGEPEPEPETETESATCTSCRSPPSVGRAMSSAGLMTALKGDCSSAAVNCSSLSESPPSSRKSPRITSYFVVVKRRDPYVAHCHL